MKYFPWHFFDKQLLAIVSCALWCHEAMKLFCLDVAVRLPRAGANRNPLWQQRLPGLAPDNEPLRKAAHFISPPPGVGPGTYNSRIRLQITKGSRFSVIQVKF